VRWRARACCWPPACQCRPPRPEAPCPFRTTRRQAPMAGPRSGKLRHCLFRRQGRLDQNMYKSTLYSYPPLCLAARDEAPDRPPEGLSSSPRRAPLSIQGSNPWGCGAGSGRPSGHGRRHARLSPAARSCRRGASARGSPPAGRRSRAASPPGRSAGCRPPRRAAGRAPVGQGPATSTACAAPDRLKAADILLRVRTALSWAAGLSGRLRPTCSSACSMRLKLTTDGCSARTR